MTNVQPTFRKKMDLYFIAWLVLLLLVAYKFYNVAILYLNFFSPAPLPAPLTDRYCPYAFNKIGGIDDRCFDYTGQKMSFLNVMDYCKKRLAFFTSKINFKENIF